MIFMLKPFTFSSKILFGYHEDDCPDDKSKIELEFSYGLDKNAADIFENLIVDDENLCSKDIVKFSPVPYTEACNHNTFKKLSSIVNYELFGKFENVSKFN